MKSKPSIPSADSAARRAKAQQMRNEVPPRSYTDIGKELGVSRQRAEQLVNPKKHEDRQEQLRGTKKIEKKFWKGKVQNPAGGQPPRA